VPSSPPRRPGPATPGARSRRPLGRGFTAAPPAPVRPVAAPFAAAFGVLVAAEDGYLGWLMADADPGWYLALPAVLALGALTGAVLVSRGRPLARRLSGSALLALSCVGPLLGVLGLAALFALLGDGEAVAVSLLLLVGPVGGLVLGLQRPVREWSGPRRAGRSGRRGGRSG